MSHDFFIHMVKLLHRLKEERKKQMRMFKDNRSINALLFISLAMYCVMVFLIVSQGEGFSSYFANVFSTNAGNMRSFLSAIHAHGDQGLFSIIFMLDFFFFIPLGCFFYFKLKAQEKHVNGILRKITSFMSYIGFSSILADGIETTVLQYMIHHHENFPGYLVLIQSPCTVLALCMDFACISWILIMHIRIRYPKQPSGR
jgi:hypothetical protein